MAPEVITSSISTIARPSIRGAMAISTRNAPCRLSARCERERPTWGGVGLTRPEGRAAKAAIDWLKFKALD